MAYVVPQQQSVPISELPFHAIGGQPAFTPRALERFVNGRRIAVLAFLLADQRPLQSPIWYTYRAGTFFMTTVANSPKHKALAKDQRVSLMIQDERPPYRAVVMDGVVELRPLDVADDPTKGMAVRYFGRVSAREYDKLTAAVYEASGLVVMSFRPTTVRGFDNTRAVGRLSLAFIRLREWLPVPRRWL